MLIKSELVPKREKHGDVQSLHKNEKKLYIYIKINKMM